MNTHLKTLREFLCNHNASDAVHLALDEITSHLRMLPEERSKRDFVTGDWVRIIGPELQYVVSKVIGFREDCRVVLDGLTGSFEAHQLEHWYPYESDEVWNKRELCAARTTTPVARSHDGVSVIDDRNDSYLWDLSDLEPYVGQKREPSVPRTPRVPPCPVGEESRIPACGDPNCKGAHSDQVYDAIRRKDEGTIHAILVWAAKRARYFERLRHKKPTRPKL